MVVVDKAKAPYLHNCIFVEGGLRTVKKYKRLLLRRIQWKDVEEADKESDAEMENESEDIQTSLDLKCHLVWQGVSAKP